MKISWRRFLHRLASVVLYCACGASAWHSAVCYALSAADNASDPAYADGWQGITHAGTAGGGAQLTSGDNGGFGFTAWNFDSAYTSPGGFNFGNYAGGLFGINDGGVANPFNNIGKSWTLAHVNTDPSQPDEYGLPRAGRGFAPLQIGQSLRVVFDNPTDRQFYKGYFIRLNGGTGGVNGNIGYKERPATLGGTPVEKMLLQRFEYANDGEFGISDANYTPTGIFDTDTAIAGGLFQVTRTGADTYDVLLDPMGPAPSFTLSDTFANPGVPVDWIEFTMFNTHSDPGFETDFYIRSIEITDAPSDPDFDNDGDVDGKDFLTWQKGFRLSGQTNNDNGDANGSGTVDAADLAAWTSKFGTTGLPVSATVPEPAGCVIACAAAGALAWRRRK